MRVHIRTYISFRLGAYCFFFLGCSRIPWDSGAPNFHPPRCFGIPSAWVLPNSFLFGASEFLPLGCSRIPSARVLPNSFRLGAPKFLPLGSSRIPSAWELPNSLRLGAPEFLPLGRIEMLRHAEHSLEIDVLGARLGAPEFLPEQVSKDRSLQFRV